MDSSLKISGLRQSLFCIFWCHLLSEHHMHSSSTPLVFCECVCVTVCVRLLFVQVHMCVTSVVHTQLTTAPINTVERSSWKRRGVQSLLSKTCLWNPLVCVTDAFMVAECVCGIVSHIICDENPRLRLCHTQPNSECLSNHKYPKPYFQLRGTDPTCSKIYIFLTVLMMFHNTRLWGDFSLTATKDKND